MTTIRALFAAALVVGTFGLALAKLPAAPPMTDAQKDEAKAKAAAAAALSAQQQAAAEARYPGTLEHSRIVVRDWPVARPLTKERHREHNHRSVPLFTTVE